MTEMTMEREGKILEDAISTFGAGAQIDMAIEEMAELTQALCKYKRLQVVTTQAEGILDNIREEMADVGIMLSQLALIFGDPVDREIYKLERLEERVQKRREEKQRFRDAVESVKVRED